MALGESSELATFSTVLTKDQVRRLKAMRDARSATHRRVSVADIAREVVEAGLVVISLGHNIGNSASDPSDQAKDQVAA